MMGRKAKTRKAQTQSHRKTKKIQYRVRNWSQYNASLVERGSLEVWIEEEVLANWKPEASEPRRRGGQVQYSAGAIECMLTLGAVLSLPLRQTEGFGRSVMGRLGVDVKVPDYTTLCKRKKDLKVNLSTTKRKEPLHILVDSTGLKVYGEGEWKVRKHGYSKRRTWRKLHLSVHPGTGVNEDTQEIEIAVLTEVGKDDAGTGGQMLQDIPDPIERVSGDGGYDQRKFYKACTTCGIAEVVVPPRRNAHIWQHGNSARPPLARRRDLEGRVTSSGLVRDQHLRRIRRIGRDRWKQETGYHRRSLVETTVFRFKTIFGGSLMARTFDRQIVEALIKCNALNIMTQLGLPDSYPVPA
jgi:IS5 family transposase